MCVYYRAEEWAALVECGLYTAEEARQGFRKEVGDRAMLYAD